MWSGKMAARWRGEDVDFNADDGDLLAGDAPIELVLSRGDVEVVKMDTQSCTDHSILAIFEDSTVASEGKSEGEDESETLLSVLTEMLDSVEDDDGTLSPFDILPDTKLLTHLDCRDNSVAPSFADRLRPRPKFTNVTFTVKRDGEKEDENNMERNSLPQLLRHQSQTLFPSKAKKAEKNEVEVFTSTSLVNLVKLMHPYCLKLHVEEGDKLRKNHTLFSKEEVWKYERPSEESDEEINVVSDDEEPVKETKGKEDGDEKRDDRTLLKSVLLNGNSPRVLPFKEKKRVSFGPVQVASFNEPAEEGFNKKNLTSGHTSETVSVPLDSTKTLGNPAGLALEPQTISSSEMNIDKAEILPPKGETKAKSLSLQQYRQLRQKRKPLVEKQRNYTTKWPSVSEPPKELPPILCLQGQRQNSCGPKTAHHYPDYTRLDINHLHNPGYKTVSHKASLPSRPSPSQTNKPNHLHCSRLKHPRLESKISPDSPLPDATTNLNVNVPVSKKSPEKNPTLLSSDPPNPVLLPLPVSHSPSPSTDLSSSEYKVAYINIDSNLESTAHLKKIQNDSSAAFPHRQPCSSEPKPQVLLANQDGSTLLQETKDKFTNITSGVSFRSPALRLAPTQTVSASECNKPQPQKHSLSPTKAAGEALEPKIPKLPSPDPVRQIKCPSSMPFSAPACSADASIPMETEVLPKAPLSTISPEEPPATHQVGSRAQSAASDSVIEAPDLTSLLEQFEETQAKVERVCENKPCLVSATPPSNLQIEGHMELDRSQPVGSEKISRLLLSPTEEPLDPSESTGTPKTLRNLPHVQMLERVDIPEPLGTEIILSTQQEQPARRKNPPSKAIQIIDPRPLPSKKNHSSASEPPPAHTSLHMCSSISADHDYCRPVDHSLTSFTQRSRAKPPLLKDISKITNESEVNTLDSSAATEWKTQTSTRQTKSILQHHSERSRTRSETYLSTDKALQFSDCIAAIGECGASEEKTAPCTLPTPPPSPPARGREKKRRYRRRSPHSDSSSSSSSCCSSSSSSSSSSGSRSPKRKKLHPRRSESSSCSSSPSRSITCSPPRHYRLSYSRSRCSRSRSRSWSQSRSPSRSRSPSPQICCRHWKDVYSSRESRKLRREHEIRIQKLKAIDERRVVYVGRIRRSMTHDELRERFSQFGEVECVSLHFRDRGDHYGFVTFYNMEDAFAAIDNGGKLRKPDELPFDICFGGRRQFCSSNYSDLDANRDADPSPAKSRFEDLDFDSLLKQAKRGLKR